MSRHNETSPAPHGRRPLTIRGAVNYSQAIEGHATQDVPNPENTRIPLETHLVDIHDARAVDTHLDTFGFTLVEHKSRVSHLRSTEELFEPYHAELIGLVSELSGADLVLPHLAMYVRFANKQGTPQGKETNLPSTYVHMDFSEKSFFENANWVLDKAGLPRTKYRRIALFQTWRAVSPPPQDFPLALTDARTPTPGNTVILDNVIGPRDVDGNVVETLLGCRSPTDTWYYFPNLVEDELLVFKGFDSAAGDQANVLHTSFDCRAAVPGAKPRESIEARFFAYWK